MAVFTTLQAVERWYMAMGMPCWSLHTNSLPKRERVELFDGTDCNEGWPQLKRAIEDRLKGLTRMSIYISSSKGNTNGLWQDIELYESPQAAIPGIGYTPATVGITESDFEKRLASERERWELKRDIEDLKSEKKNSIGALDRFFNTIAENPSVITPLLDRIAMIAAVARGVIPPGAIPAPVNGMPQTECPVNAEKPTNPDDPGSDDDEVFKGYSDEDVAVIQNAVDTIKTVSGHNPAHVMAKLAAALKKNPSLINLLEQV